MREDLLTEFKRTYKIWEEAVRLKRDTVILDFTWKEYCEARDKLVFLKRKY